MHDLNMETIIPVKLWHDMILEASYIPLDNTAIIDIASCLLIATAVLVPHNLQRIIKRSD